MYSENELKYFLDEQYRLYNRPAFIDVDPISIPHAFTQKEDIEIAGLFAATMAWGNRKAILANGQKLMALMDHQPYNFVMHATARDMQVFKKFVHRTFQSDDVVFFIRGIRHIYKTRGSLEAAFFVPHAPTIKQGIVQFRTCMLSVSHAARSRKHLSDPDNGSAAKRLCMYLRWMVRKDPSKVDFGIWETLLPSQLCMPLDVHTGRVSRALGILKRKQNDWRAVEELTAVLRALDAKDPIKYDIAIFGMGVETKPIKLVLAQPSS